MRQGQLLLLPLCLLSVTTATSEDMPSCLHTLTKDSVTEQFVGGFYEVTPITLPLTRYVAFDFRTRVRDGVLVYGRQWGGEDFVVVLLNEGYLLLSVICERAQVDFVVAEAGPLNDGNWHHVEVNLVTNGVVFAVVDNAKTRKYDVRCGNIPSFVFGGIRPSDSQYSGLEHRISTYPQFEGCIRHLTLDSIATWQFDSLCLYCAHL
ncbi:neurexin-1-like [Babylonia areolata]|uniref:neurexin-1-like n=1 Tax=Babylonia areolata TaxID=304850 RepID=UPI003FD42A8F